MSDVFDFLNKHGVGVLATSSLGGKPQAAAINYIVADNKIYFITRKQSKKYENLKANSSVAFVVGSSDDTDACVQLEGKATELTDEAIQKEIMSRFTARPKLRNIYLSGKIFKEMKGVDFCLFKIDPDWMRHLTHDKK